MGIHADQRWVPLRYEADISDGAVRPEVVTRSSCLCSLKNVHLYGSLDTAQRS